MINASYTCLDVEDRIYPIWEQTSLINHLSVIRHASYHGELCLYLWFDVYVLSFWILNERTLVCLIWKVWFKATNANKIELKADKPSVMLREGRYNTEDGSWYFL